MKKEWIRDYATGAFLRYARLGCPTREQYEAQLRQSVYRRVYREEPRVVLLKAERSVGVNAPLLADLDAVNAVLNTLRECGKEEICGAVRAVYFADGGRVPSRGELVARVRCYAAHLPADERTVYRWLKYARELFAVKRGLTLE